MRSSIWPPTIRDAIDIGRLPWIRPLAVDYQRAFDRLAPFFAGDPSDPAAWDAAVVRAQAHGRRRSDTSAAVVAQLRRRGAPSQAVAAAERLADPGAVAAVTGQQAGLFGGPVFTLLKAITTIKIADRLTSERRVSANPVFWIDAEDHDWAEVASCSVLDTELERRTITLSPPPGAGERPVADVRLDGSIGSAIDELAAALGTTEFSATVLTRLRNAYRSGAGMAEAFARWLDWLLGERGLVVYDASDPATKPLAREVFARELSAPGVSSALAAEAGRALVARGYHAQVEPHDDGVALFYLDGGRHSMRVRNGEISTGLVNRSAADWAAEALAGPEAFSPNVLLRPIVQDTLFPTVCYVAGPNELAYLAELGGVYEHFGVPQPLFVPRATATLVDSAAAKFLERHEVPLEQLRHDDESILNQLLEHQLPPEVEEALGGVTAAVESGMGRLIAAIPAVDPTLEGAARSVLGRMQHDLHGLHGKVIQASKKRNETLRRQFRRTRGQAFPGGHPQERAIGYIYLLNRYGPALIERLMADLPLDGGHHYVMTI